MAGLWSGPERSVRARISPGGAAFATGSPPSVPPSSPGTAAMYSSELRKSRSQSGLRLDEKTRCRLSEVHAAAEEWLKSPEVTWVGVPPSAETTKMWV